MYLRKTIYRLKPEFATDAGQAEFEHELTRSIFPLDGLVSAAHFPNDDGSWTIVVVWHDEEFAQEEDAAEKIDAAWDKLAFMLTGPRTVMASGINVWETI